MNILSSVSPENARLWGTRLDMDRSTVLPPDSRPGQVLNPEVGLRGLAFYPCLSAVIACVHDTDYPP